MASRKACKYCGQTELEWTTIAGKFRLKDPTTGALHACLKNGTDRPGGIPYSRPITPAPSSLTELVEQLDGQTEPTHSEPSILETLLAEL